ncbi:MATE family efflux transporter [Paenibacillus sp.]|uniref:MATE family efflux transporter n=1 Tax=Paenibacillus sp. TaxID=58172 RepID=UPI0028118949|nr:MATE family efflux transporter [Paenibacillus sp.]
MGSNKKKGDSWRSMSLFAISWPIFVESALQMLLRISDTFMLSKVSDDAVAAVGVATQLLLFAVLLFNVISYGASIVISQYLGAGRDREVERLTGAAIGLNALFGIAVSASVVAFSGPLLRLFGLEPALLQEAERFLWIAGGALVVQAVLSAVVAVIQAHGFTRSTMMVTIGMNVLNVCGNVLVIYGPMGFPKLGVPGVALSTVVAQLVGLTVNLYVLRKHIGVKLNASVLTRWKREHVRQVLSVGFPSSVNNLSYSASQLVTTAFITTLGASMLSTKIYTQNLTFLIIVLVASIGRGGQLIIGRIVGAGEAEEAYRRALRHLAISMGLTLTAVSLVAVFRVPLLRLFTHDASIVGLGASLLLLGFLLEPGRNFNVVMERSLHAAGDARYSMISALAVTWFASVPLIYLLGVHWGFGLYGMWFAFMFDEWARGLLLFHRWKSRAWQKKAIVRRGAAVGIAE